VTPYLLDINVLLALCDPLHVHYEAAHRWFAQEGRRSWATCPLTENGFVRIASHPQYPNRPGDVLAVLAILRRFCKAKEHQFWSEDLSIRDLLRTEVLLTSAQVTDVYLLGLAVHRGGRLATLDQRLPVQAIMDGKKALELIHP
jgi:toxin-antitoxin system PIN domain toxin